MNCSKIRSVTSSAFIHPLFPFCRHSPQLILRLYYVLSRTSGVAETSTNRANFAEPRPTIPGLIGSVNTSAFVGTNPTGELRTSRLPVIRPQSVVCALP